MIEKTFIADGVWLYKADIRDISDADFEKYFLLMSDEKRKTVEHFRSEEDKKRSIAADMLARLAVSERCGIPEADISFYREQGGKPHVRGDITEFNVSHSADIVVCAVSDKPIGVDVEKIRDIDLGIANRFFTKNEIRYVGNSIRNFFEIWTKKEAAVKRDGAGLRALSSIETYATEAQSTVLKTLFSGEYVISLCF